MARNNLQNISHQIEYNTQQEELIFPEYGRNVQMLIKKAKAIQDVKEKQAYMDSIIELMFQMNPQSKNVDDYKEKLWKHAFRIANYDIEGVLPPSGEVPTPENLYKRPDRIGYPPIDTRFRHYGQNVQQMVKKALKMDVGVVKSGFVETIGSYMKLAYKTWNKEHYVSDEIIKTDLDTLSNGLLTLDDDAFIDNLANAKRNKSKAEMSRSNNGGGRDNRYRSNDRDNRNDRGGDRGGRRNDNRDNRNDRNDRGGDRGRRR